MPTPIRVLKIEKASDLFECSVCYTMRRTLHRMSNGTSLCKACAKRAVVRTREPAELTLDADGRYKGGSKRERAKILSSLHVLLRANTDARRAYHSLQGARGAAEKALTCGGLSVRRTRELCAVRTACARNLKRVLRGRDMGPFSLYFERDRLQRLLYQWGGVLT